MRRRQTSADAPTGKWATVMYDRPQTDSHRRQFNFAGHSPQWRPTYDLLAKLLLGAIASLACGGLYVAADLWSWENGVPPGFTPSLELNLWALLPELVIVWVYWGMAKGIPSIQHPRGWIENPAAGFRGGSLCAFGNLCALAVNALCFPKTDVFLDDTAWLLIWSCAIGHILLAMVAIFFMVRSGRRGGSVGGMVFLLFILGNLLLELRFLWIHDGAPIPGQDAPPVNAGAQPQSTLGTAADLTYLAGLLCYVFLRLWFAFVKLRERRLLGSLAAIVAGIELLNIGLIVAMIFGYLGFTEYALASIVPDAGRGILQFAWFLQLRQRADQDPPPVKDYDWNIPMHEQHWDNEGSSKYRT
jgi:hypothetical protein